jgi:hypothetical protein
MYNMHGSKAFLLLQTISVIKYLLITLQAQTRFYVLIFNQKFHMSHMRRARGWAPGFNSRQGVDFPLLHNVQTNSGIHPASYSIWTGYNFPGVKRPDREADYSYPSSAEVKNGGAIPSLADTSSWRGA